jgi:micrococcal nuclease
MNEIMIREGYAKPFKDVFCEMLSKYEDWSLKAKIDKKGLFSIVDWF